MLKILTCPRCACEVVFDEEGFMGVECRNCDKQFGQDELDKAVPYNAGQDQPPFDWDCY